MNLTINIAPELESRLREEAARQGLDPRDYVMNALRERLDSQPEASPRHLSPDEARLLEQINQGLSPATWQRYNQLIAKRRAETLSRDEQAELIEISDRLEGLASRRLELLVELAGLRGTPLETLMDQLGIKAPK